MRSMPRIVSLGVLLALIVTLGSTFFRVVAPFLLPLFLAVMTAIVCQPVFHYFLKRTNCRVKWAAGLTTFSIIAAIMVPLITGIMFASLQLYVFAHNVADTREFQRIFSQIGKTNVMAAQDEPSTEEVDADPTVKSETAPPEPSTTIPEIAKPEAVDPATANNGNVPDSTPAEATEVAQSPEDGQNGAAELEEPAESDIVIPAQVAKRQETLGKWFDELVAFGNKFLPKDQQRDPVAVAEEMRSSIRKAVIDLGNRSLGMAGTTVGILAATAGTLTTLILAFAIYTIALFYFLSDGTAILEGVEQLIPVHAEYKREIMNEFAKVVRSVVVATFLAAIAQGLSTGFALWFFGFPHILVLTVLAMLGALVPLVGTPIVWIPCVFILFFNGHPIQAILLLIYGAGFVGFMDNVIRAYVLNSDTKLHPLLAFVSVIGGLQAMGLWGVFIGPIVASCLYALVKIFNHELMLLSRERFATAVADTLSQQPGKAPRRYSGTDSMTTEMLREIARSAEQSSFGSRPATPPPSSPSATPPKYEDRS